MTREELEYVINTYMCHVPTHRDGLKFHDAEQRAEIARLKNDLSHWTFTRLQQLESENKSLREALQGVVEAREGWYQQAQAQQTLKELPSRQ